MVKKVENEPLTYDHPATMCIFWHELKKSSLQHYNCNHYAHMEGLPRQK